MSCDLLKFWQISVNISKTIQDRYIFTMEDIMKSYTVYQMAQMPVTLNDPEGYSSVSELFKCKSITFCAVLYKISTRDVSSRTSPWPRGFSRTDAVAIKFLALAVKSLEIPRTWLPRPRHQEIKLPLSCCKLLYSLFGQWTYEGSNNYGRLTVQCLIHAERT